jgi:large subunit ribosomal protein L15
MKLHDLQPAPGSRTPRTRVGRGIAAGKGKTAGRGTKGQKARAGASIPPWFEGGQTPLHQRIPKLRGFKNRFKIHYEVVNVGAIGDLAERGAFEVESPSGKGTKAAPITINQDILRAVGLVRTLDKPLKVLGAGELNAALFVVADAFTASARTKIEGAGGSVNVLEVPTSSRPALGVTPAAKPEAETPKAAPAKARAARAKAETDESESEVAAAEAFDVTAGDAAPDEAATTSSRKASTRAAAVADEPETAPEATEATAEAEAAAARPPRRSTARPAAESDDEPAAASDDAEPAGDDA